MSRVQLERGEGRPRRQLPPQGLQPHRLAPRLASVTLGVLLGRWVERARPTWLSKRVVAGRAAAGKLGPGARQMASIYVADILSVSD